MAGLSVGRKVSSPRRAKSPNRFSLSLTGPFNRTRRDFLAIAQPCDLRTGARLIADRSAGHASRGNSRSTFVPPGPMSELARWSDRSRITIVADSRWGRRRDPHSATHAHREAVSSPPDHVCFSEFRGTGDGSDEECVRPPNVVRSLHGLLCCDRSFTTERATSSRSRSGPGFTSSSA